MRSTCSDSEMRRDGLEQRLLLKDAADLLAQVAQDLLGVEGLAKELAVDPAADALAQIANAEHDHDADRDDGELLRAGDGGIERGRGGEHDGRCEYALNDADTAARQCVLHSLAQHHANVERAVHHNDVRHGDGEDHHRHQGEGEQQPVGIVRAAMIHSEVIEDQQEHGAQGSGHAPIEQLQAAAVVGRESRFVVLVKDGREEESGAGHHEQHDQPSRQRQRRDQAIGGNIVDRVAEIARRVP